MTEHKWGFPPFLKPSGPKPLTGRVDELKSTLRVQNPDLIAARSGSSFLMLGPGRGELHIPLFDRVHILCWPHLAGCNDKDDHLPDFQLALLLYYLITADGSPLTGKWVSFADLPDGRMYNAAFQGYTGDEVTKVIGLNLDGFKSVCTQFGGEVMDVGSASYTFRALPHVPLMLTYWLGDEDFPSSCKVLFDESASHYLPIDACAILGSMLTGRIIKSASNLTIK